MTNEERKTKWAVLISKRERLAKGEEVMIRVITSYGGHIAGLEEEDIQTITVSDITEIAPNMVKVQSEESAEVDYYIYNYSFPNKSLCSPETVGWREVDAPAMPLIGEHMTFTRRRKFKDEVLHTNPVLNIDVLSTRKIIAWCKDKEIGHDIGYIMSVKDAKPVPKGNFFWLWSIGIQRPNQEDLCKVTMFLNGELFTDDINFVPKSAKALGDSTLFEGEDGNFYITHNPITSCWKE